MPTKLLLLGLDAAEPALLQRWMADDKLPAISALMRGGTSGEVHGVEGFYTGSSWASFYTGLNPAGHGFHRVDQLRSGTYDFYRPLDTATGVGGTPLWQLASDAGRRVAVLDVPLAPLGQNLDGIQVADWGGQEYMDYRTSPASLADELLALVGAYPGVHPDGRLQTVDDIEGYVATLELAVARKTDLTLRLLDREDWDLFMQVFLEAHFVGHECWHVHDPAHPAHDPELLAVIDPVERVYRAIDDAVGTVLEHAGDAHVLVFSLHGMSAYRGADFLLREILQRLGVMVPPDAQGRNLSSLPRMAWKLLPEGARDAMRPTLKRLVESSRQPAKPLQSSTGEGGSVSWADVAASQCFTMPNGSPVSGIRLNLIGREPTGVLKPGSEADAFCEQLTSELLAITDERTGSPLVADVLRTGSLYAGARLDALPDLLVQWSDVPTGTLAYGNGRGATIRARSAAIGVVEGANTYHRTGDHIPSGMVFFAGPGVPARSMADPVQLTDLYPTICRSMGLPAGTVDGAVVPELVVPSS